MWVVRAERRLPVVQRSATWSRVRTVLLLAIGGISLRAPAEPARRRLVVAHVGARRLAVRSPRARVRGGELRVPLGARPNRAADSRLVSGRRGTAEWER